MSRRIQGNQRHAFDAATIAVCAIVVLVPLVATAIPRHRVVPPDRLAPRPTMPHSLREAAKLPWQVQKWFEQAVGMRDESIRAVALFKVKALGVSTSEQAMLGKDGWIFLRSDGSLEDACNLRPFTTESLATWTGLLQTRAAWCKQRGTPYIFMIGPNKHHVYPEYLPDEARPLRPLSRLDQLERANEASPTPVRLVDPTRELLAAKGDGLLYLKTDTHWNARGAFVAYRTLMAELATSFPGVHPLTADEVRFETTTTVGGDMARLIGLRTDYAEQTVIATVLRPGTVTATDDRLTNLWDGIEVQTRYMVVTQCPTGEIDRAVIFRDSMGELLIPYLSRHFKRAVFVASDEFDPAIVEAEKPDVVIQELVERRLMTDRVEDPALRTAPNP